MNDRVLSSVVVVGLLWAGSASAASPKPAGGAAVPAGAAKGTLTAEGKSFTLAHAAAFTDEKDKTTFLLVTDEPVPAAKWTSHSDIFPYRMDHKFHGVGFHLDAAGKMTGADVYAGQFPTGTIGYFTVTLTPGGKRRAGTARSTTRAEKAKEPMSLNGSFNAGTGWEHGPGGGGAVQRAVEADPGRALTRRTA